MVMRLWCFWELKAKIGMVFVPWFDFERFSFLFLSLMGATATRRVPARLVRVYCCLISDVTSDSRHLGLICWGSRFGRRPGFESRSQNTTGG